MNNIHKITIDMCDPRIPAKIYAMQGDANSRKIQMVLTSRGSAWTPPEGVATCAGYLKPDGTKGIYDALPDGTSAVSLQNNTVTVDIAPQVLTAPGDVLLAVSLVLDGAVISTFPVIIHVEPLPGFGGSSEDYEQLCSLLPTVTETDNGKVMQVVDGLWRATIFPAVIYDAAQELTDEQKAQARGNIGALSADEAVMLAAGTAIAKGTDLDTMLDYGNYKCTSAATVATLLNCPTTGAFKMRVGSPAPGVTGYISQEISMLLRGTKIYRYTYDGGTNWKPWIKTFDYSDLNEARQTLNYIGTDPITSPDEDTPAAWAALGTGMAYIGSADRLIDQPGTYGAVANYVAGSLVHQIWHSQNSNARMYKRAGNANGWYKTWNDVFDETTLIPAHNGGVGMDTSSDMGEAEHLACVQRFVDRMNENAAVLGMGNTKFVTPSGLCTQPINSSKTSSDTAYNSYTTAHDLLRLLVAARHTPTVYAAMGEPRCDYFMDGGSYYAYHIVTHITVWLDWAEEHGYTMLAAKGGSLSGAFGEIGANGILNMAILVQDTNSDIYAVAVVGLEKSEGDVMRTIIHDLISMVGGAAETSAISEANSRAYPVGMAAAKLTASGTFDDDITALASGVYYNRDAVRVAASTSKIMAAITALPYMGNHNCSVAYDDMVGGSGVTLAQGDTISTTDALNLMLAVSDNALATLLARVCGARMEASGQSGAVSYDAEQALSAEEQARARANIGAAAETDIPEMPAAVLYGEEQSLTDDQKTQARKNIGALGAGFVSESGIGKSTTGTEYEVDGETVVAEDGAEIFNDYTDNKATGKCSHVEGISNIVTGYSAHAEGRKNSVSGSHAHAEGLGNAASGNSAHAEGVQGEASGPYSHTEGAQCHATGAYSHAEGVQMTAAGEYQHVQGKYGIEDADSVYAHIVGNGTNITHANAHTLDWSGNAVFAGTVSGSGADYAEHFEWLDGNPEGIDRIGMIVTLEGDKIRPAMAGEEILGVVSGTAMVIGDNAEWEWHDKYLTDSYGRVITEMVEEFIEIENPETGEIERQSAGYFPHRKLNPEWDATQAYTRRADRPEWDIVGLMGKLHVNDDGTCTVGGYAACGDNGVATASAEKTNMRVMRRIADNIILAFKGF